MEGSSVYFCVGDNIDVGVMMEKIKQLIKGDGVEFILD